MKATEAAGLSHALDLQCKTARSNHRWVRFAQTAGRPFSLVFATLYAEWIVVLRLFRKCDANQRPSMLACARQMKHCVTNGFLKTLGSLVGLSACKRVVLSQHWNWAAIHHERVTDNPDKYQ